VGIRPGGRWLAPALSIAGLLVIALITVDLFQGGVPFVGGKGGSGGTGGHRRATPDPGAPERGRRPT